MRKEEMIVDRASIKLFAKQQMKAQYGIAIGSLLLFALIASAASGITCGLGTLLLVPVLQVGYDFIQLKIFRGQQAQISDLFSGFNNFGRNLGGMLWETLWICLWSMLFYIPGIIKSYAYCLTPYILADSKRVGATEALKVSMAMTNGHKWEIFVFQLSFIGWHLLGGLTCGILDIFYTMPYEQCSMAGLYLELRNQAIAKGLVDAGLFDEFAAY